MPSTTSPSRKRPLSDDETISSSDSDSSSDHRSKKSKSHKHHHHHKKKHKKDKKDRKGDKKDKKKKKSHKKSKRDSKDKRSHMDDAFLDLHGTVTGLSREQEELDAKEIADFKHAVQSRKAACRPSASEDMSQLAGQLNSSAAGSSSLLSAASNSATQDIFASSSDIASKYGISKGLIRTAEASLSITQKFSKTIFGGDDDNPATRQRMKREHAAQQAMKTARNVIAARQAAAAASTGQGNTADVCNLMNTFRSSSK